MNLAFQNEAVAVIESNKLFQDFIQRESKLAPFFPTNFQQHPEEEFNRRTAQFVFRAQLTQLLTEQNKHWNAPESTLQNIERLQQENTLAVVTGQQVGILGGPLFTLYKAWATVQYSQILQERYPHFQFVPVFWIEVGDNDFREVNHLYVPDQNHKLQRLELPVPENDFRSLHQRTLPEEMTELLHQLFELLPRTEFTDGLVVKLEQFYRPGIPFADAFARWLLDLMGNRGLILLNPSHPTIKQMAAPVFLQALKASAEAVHQLQEKARELEALGYHDQLRVRPEQTLLFLQDKKDAARCRIDIAENGYSVRHPQRPYLLYPEELEEIITSQPERISPNVALRPVMQDVVLPTAAYIAGPGEISYLAQVSAIYRIFQVPMPLIFPRPRLTIVEKHINRILHKFGLSYQQVFEEDESLIPDALRKYTQPSIDEIFENSRANILDNLELIGDVLLVLNSGLETALNRTRNHMLQALQQLQNKVDSVLKQKMDTELRQLGKVLTYMKPNRQPQERIFNIVYFLNKYGPDFLDALYSHIQAEETNHQFLRLL